MIPCHICGKDASTGFIQGLPPAPDSQKLALCRLHDNPANRMTLEETWKKMSASLLRASLAVAEHKVQPVLYTVTVNFKGGGVLSVPCSGCKTTEQGTLAIEEKDGGTLFIPVQHIRDYTLRPVAEFAEENSG